MIKDRKMEETKNKKSFKESVNLTFFVCAILNAGVELWLLVLCFRNFSILHAAWLTMSSVLLALNILWSQAAIFEDRDALNKKIKEWDKKRKAAVKANVPFTEPRPKKSKILTPNTTALFFIVLATVFYGSFFFALINIAVPEGKSAYVRDIRELKEKNPDRYYFFPDNIPDGAEKVKWKMQPSIMQGAGYEVLYFYTDSHFIHDQIDLYCSGIEPKSYYNMPVGVLTDEFDDAGLERVEWYEIYNNGDWNHEHAWGIFTEPESNLIGYFCQ